MDKQVQHRGNDISVLVKHNVGEPVADALNAILFGTQDQEGFFCEITPTGGLPGSCAGAGTDKFYATFGDKRYLIQRQTRESSYWLEIRRADKTRVPDDVFEGINKAVAEYKTPDKTNQ